MKLTVAFIVLSLVLVVSAYQIFANTELQKAGTEVPAEKNTNQQTFEQLWAQNNAEYNSLFEKQLKACKISRGPQKNYIQYSDQDIVKLTLLLTYDKKTKLEKTKALFEYVSDEFQYKVYDNWRTTNKILETKDGDCTDKSILLASLLKNIGVDAFVVYGKEVNDYSHAWVAADIGGSWIQLDSTTGDFFYVYDCLEDENCEYHEYYAPIAGMFDGENVLRCNG